MISYGWRKIGSRTTTGLDNGTTISNVATTLEGDYVVDCDGFRWAMLAVFTNNNTAGDLDIYGTTFNVEDAQTFEVAFNTHLMTVAKNTTVSLALPDNVYGEDGTFSNYDIASIAEIASGVSDAPGIISSYLNMQGERGLLAKTDDTGTGETSVYEHYYSNFGDTDGPSWVAIPVGCFSKLQLKHAHGNTATSFICANMIG